MNSPENFCPGRHLEDLPGHVEFKLVSNHGEMITNGKEFSYPVCLCHALEGNLLVNFNNLLSQKESEKTGNLLENLRNLKIAIEEFKSGHVENKRNLLDRLTQLSMLSREGLSQKPELNHEWGPILQVCDRALRTLATDIRFGD